MLRLALLGRLAMAREPLTVTEVADCCGVHLSGVSRHLKMLHGAGSWKRSGRAGKCVTGYAAQPSPLPCAKWPTPSIAVWRLGPKRVPREFQPDHRSARKERRGQASTPGSSSVPDMTPAPESRFLREGTASPAFESRFLRQGTAAPAAESCFSRQGTASPAFKSRFLRQGTTSPAAESRFSR